MKRFIGYVRDYDGLIALADIEVFEDELYVGYSQIWLTAEKGPEIIGWPEEGATVIARNGNGKEVYIPRHCLSNLGLTGLL